MKFSWAAITAWMAEAIICSDDSVNEGCRSDLTWKGTGVCTVSEPCSFGLDLPSMPNQYIFPAEPSCGSCYEIYIEGLETYKANVKYLGSFSPSGLGLTLTSSVWRQICPGYDGTGCAATGNDSCDIPRSDVPQITVNQVGCSTENLDVSSWNIGNSELSEKTNCNYFFTYNSLNQCGTFDMPCPAVIYDPDFATPCRTILQLYSSTADTSVHVEVVKQESGDSKMEIVPAAWNQLCPKLCNNACVAANQDC